MWDQWRLFRDWLRSNPAPDRGRSPLLTRAAGHTLERVTQGTSQGVFWRGAGKTGTAARSGSGSGRGQHQCGEDLRGFSGMAQLDEKRL